jgi:hypothetical protein
VVAKQVAAWRQALMVSALGRRSQLSTIQVQGRQAGKRTNGRGQEGKKVKAGKQAVHMLTSSNACPMSSLGQLGASAAEQKGQQVMSTDDQAQHAHIFAGPSMSQQAGRLFGGCEHMFAGARWLLSKAVWWLGGELACAQRFPQDANVANLITCHLQQQAHALAMSKSTTHAREHARPACLLVSQAAMQPPTAAHRTVPGMFPLQPSTTHLLGPDLDLVTQVCLLATTRLRAIAKQIWAEVLAKGCEAVEARLQAATRRE